jgi:hypothetical protein
MDKYTTGGNIWRQRKKDHLGMYFSIIINVITSQDVYFEIEGLWYYHIYCKGWIKFTQ